MLHKIMNNVVAYFHGFSNGTIFSMNVGFQYLTFNRSFVWFPDKLYINEHSTYSNGQFGGCLIKIKQILSILQGFFNIS